MKSSTFLGFYLNEPSPEVNPVDLYDGTDLVYEGSGTITLVVKDDDNIRIGVGQSSDSISIV